MNTNKIYAESIANDYSKKEDSKVIRLKKLDRKAKMPALLFGWIFGIISTLVLGLGMCFAMEVLASGTTAIIIGVIIGIIGIASMIINYPIFNKIMKVNKEKYAADIIALAKDITEEN